MMVIEPKYIRPGFGSPPHTRLKKKKQQKQQHMNVFFAIWHLKLKMN
ncbi:MAG TPA: hypothetical protein VFI70_13830 [Nitrososphaeraceae archaeon]|nr:hypothetical protein [Nitrososphaeraceae archaeon]